MSYCSRSFLERQPAHWWGDVLGIALLGESTAGSWPVPAAPVATPVLGDAAPCEVWRVAGPVTDGRYGDVRFRCSRDALFGCLELDERSLPRGDGASSALQALTESAYRQLFALLDETGYRDLFRVWNYFPQITARTDRGERYWQFNAGRQDAFLASRRITTGRVPAACALGTDEGLFVLYFLALRAAPVAIENPRQVSAYDYPQRYGPRSPTFARASLARLGEGPVLFVSGTASIVGHETRHPGDIRAQTAETLRNIEAVLGEARRVEPQSAFRLEDLAYKVYVRHGDDVAAVHDEFRARVGKTASAIFVRADVCRADLLVEIEACGGAASELHA